MSEYLEPINNSIREKLKGTSNVQVREEEKFMWKYLEEKQIKKNLKHPDENQDEEEAEEEFAELAIKKEMKRLTSGAGMVDESDEDVDYSD